MFPPTLELGPLRLAWSSIVMTCGFTAACAWYVRTERAAGEGWPAAARRSLDGIWAALVLALVAGRAGYVMGQGSYFLEHPSEALQIWQGGLSAHGALLGLAAGSWLSTRRPARWLARLDRLLVPLAVLQTAAWGSCWLAGCAYGDPIDVTQQPWFAPFDWPDLYGIHAPRVPVQLFGVMGSLLLLALALGMARSAWRPGRRFALVLAFAAAFDFGLQQLRADETNQLLGLRLAAWVDLGLFMGAAILLWWLQRRRFAQT